MAYTADSCEMSDLNDFEQVSSFMADDNVVWVHVDGLKDAGLYARIGETFGIHPLSLDDVANAGQRPKFVDFDDYLLVTLKQLSYDSVEKQLSAYHFSLIVRDGMVISFAETEVSCLDLVRRRIRTGRGRIRRSGSGYLAYAVVDAVVDRYYSILAEIGDEIERFEEEMLTRVDEGQLETIYGVKRELIFLRKHIWPLREVLSLLLKSESDLLPEANSRFFANVHDHLIHLIDTIDALRDLLSSLLDLYMSIQSNRMNDVMRTLTIIATIFIPLTFLAGIYGMNFKIMPELDWQWGYFILLGIMVGIAGGMLLFFKRKEWL